MIYAINHAIKIKVIKQAQQLVHLLIVIFHFNYPLVFFIILIHS